VKRSFFSLSLR